VALDYQGAPQYQKVKAMAWAGQTIQWLEREQRVLIIRRKK